MQVEATLRPGVRSRLSGNRGAQDQHHHREPPGNLSARSTQFGIAVAPSLPQRLQRTRGGRTALWRRQASRPCSPRAGGRYRKLAPRAVPGTRTMPVPWPWSPMTTRRVGSPFRSPRYLTAYDLSIKNAFESREGLRARKAPWTERMRSLFTNTRRKMCALHG
jgi:hypothetical protein